LNRYNIMKYRKLISISDENYLALKQRGTFGDSFNDVLGELLQNSKKVKRAVG
jgi:predicted CopG family antitoxin